MYVPRFKSYFFFSLFSADFGKKKKNPTKIIFFKKKNSEEKHSRQVQTSNPSTLTSWGSYVFICFPRFLNYTFKKQAGFFCCPFQPIFWYNYLSLGPSDRGVGVMLSHLLLLLAPLLFWLAVLMPGVNLLHYHHFFLTPPPSGLYYHDSHDRYVADVNQYSSFFVRRGRRADIVEPLCPIHELLSVNSTL